jgi:hypothetical protein
LCIYELNKTHSCEHGNSRILVLHFGGLVCNCQVRGQILWHISRDTVKFLQANTESVYQSVLQSNYSVQFPGHSLQLTDSMVCSSLYQGSKQLIPLLPGENNNCLHSGSSSSGNTFGRVTCAPHLFSWRMKMALPGVRTVNLSIESYVQGSDQFNMPALYVYASHKRNSCGNI